MIKNFFEIFKDCFCSSSKEKVSIFAMKGKLTLATLALICLIPLFDSLGSIILLSLTLPIYFLAQLAVAYLLFNLFFDLNARPLKFLPKLILSYCFLALALHIGTGISAILNLRVDTVMQTFSAFIIGPTALSSLLAFLLVPVIHLIICKTKSITETYLKDSQELGLYRNFSTATNLMNYSSIFIHLFLGVVVLIATIFAPALYGFTNRVEVLGICYELLIGIYITIYTLPYLSLCIIMLFSQQGIKKIAKK